MSETKARRYSVILILQRATLYEHMLRRSHYRRGYHPIIIGHLAEIVASITEQELEVRMKLEIGDVHCKPV